MTLAQNKRAVGIFSSRRDVEEALHELRDSGFPMSQVSVVAKNADSHDLNMSGAGAIDDETEVEEGARKGAIAGGALGSLTGLLVGLGALAIPGIGPIMLAGAAATALATAISGGAIGAAAGGLIGGLIGLGIPEDRARAYSDRVSQGDYLLMVDGTENDINLAQTILSRRGIQDWGIYDAPYSSGIVDSRDEPAPVNTPYNSGVVDPHDNLTRRVYQEPIL